MTFQSTRLAVVLLCAACITSCTTLIGESFEGYTPLREAGPSSADDDAGDARASDGPDAEIDAGDLTPRDAEVADAATVSPDASDSVLLDASLDDAGDAAEVAPIRLGRDGGCEGTPFRSFEFDHDLEGWKVEYNAPVDASVAQVAVGGSPDLGALRFDIAFGAGNEGTKVIVGLADKPAIRCMSARIQIAPNTFDDDLTAHPGSWTVAALSPSGCFAQRPYDNRRDLEQQGVWYEVAFDTKDFRNDDKACDFSEVGTIAVGIANAFGTTTAKPAEVFIDHVALY